MLIVKKLDKNATLPTVANPHEDAGFDIRCLEDVVVPSKGFTSIKTGISAQYRNFLNTAFALKVEGRSSLASLGIFTMGGIIDSFYEGEIVVFLGNLSDNDKVFSKGDKIAQLVPHKELADEVKEVEHLEAGKRGAYGFGSSGSN